MDEAPIWISINGERRVMLNGSPLRTDALAVGHLIAEAWVHSVDEIASLRREQGPGGAHGIAVTLPAARVREAMALQRHRLSHGCGLRHLIDCAAPAAVQRERPAPPELTETFRALFAAAAATAAGGVHAVAFCDAAGALAYTSVDVARHCAVDRAIGLAALDRDSTTQHGLVISSRISGAIALKAVHAGVPWVASRSIATPLARELAEAGGIRLLEQAVRRS